MVLEIALIIWVEGGEGWRRGRGGFVHMFTRGAPIVTALEKPLVGFLIVGIEPQRLYHLSAPASNFYWNNAYISCAQKSGEVLETENK